MDPMNTQTREERYGSDGLTGLDPLAGAPPGQPRSGSMNPGADLLDIGMEERTQFTGSEPTGMSDMDEQTQQSDSSTNGQSSASQMKEKASELAGQAGQKAEAGMHKSADGLKKAAEKARSVSEDRSGTMGSIGTQAADALDKGAGYLGQGDTEQMIHDLESLVRKRPVESLLVAAGVGFVVSKAMR